MTFGSDAVFRMIGEFIANTDDANAYDALYEIVTRQCRRTLLRDYRLRSMLDEDDLEDIAQTVNWKVCQNLVDFYYRSMDASEMQRNAWLKKIVKNTAEDFLRKEKRIPIVSLDILVQRPDHPDSPIGDPQETLDKKSQVLDSVADICMLPTTASRIIAILLGKIGVSFSETRTSVSAKKLILQLDGKTLFEAFDTIRFLLSEIMEEDVPADIFEGLIEKLNTPADDVCVGDGNFDLNEKQISNLFGWLHGKLDDEKDRDEDDPNK